MAISGDLPWLPPEGSPPPSRSVGSARHRAAALGPASVAGPAQLGPSPASLSRNLPSDFDNDDEYFWKYAEDLPWIRPPIRPEHPFWDPEDRRHFATTDPEEALMTGRLWNEQADSSESGPRLILLPTRTKHGLLPDPDNSYMNLKGGHSPFLGARAELQGAYDNGRRLECAPGSNPAKKMYHLVCP